MIEIDIRKRMSESYAQQNNMTPADGGSLKEMVGGVLLSNDNIYIIGSEVVFRTDTPGTQGTGDSQILLFNAIADNLKIPKEERPKGTSDWYSWLRNNCQDRNRCEVAWNSIRRQTFEYISDELYGFLTNGIELKLIETIFTTCIDTTLEDLMREICKVLGREFRVYNFKNNRQMEEYLQEMQSGKYVALVYLWGKIGDCVPGINKTPIEFVYNDDDAMETIAQYIKQSVDSKNKLLQDVFFSRRAMAIGCRFDDWKFRFFWYSLRGEISKLYNGTVCYSCDNPQTDPLYIYLKDTKGLHVHDNSRVFLKTMTEVMESEELFAQITKKRCANANGIFLSYATEDVKTAAQIFRHLTDDCNFPVWMDNKSLRANERYDSLIQKAIHNCDVFMPILSSQTASDLQNGVDGRYYMKEWKNAYKEGKTIFPITVGDYDFKKEYHLVFRRMCGMSETENDIHICTINEMDKIEKELIKYLAD